MLHNGEERVKRIFRDQLAELAGLLEVGISLLVVVALMLAVVPLIKMLPGLLVDTNEVEISLFLQRALDIVIGIEFIKMLAKHSPGSALEVLLYAIARHMIVGHESAVEKLYQRGIHCAHLLCAQVPVCSGVWCNHARRPQGTGY